jgi:hypothetical protein
MRLLYKRKSPKRVVRPIARFNDFRFSLPAFNYLITGALWGPAPAGPGTPLCGFHITFCSKDIFMGKKKATNAQTSKMAAKAAKKAKAAQKIERKEKKKTGKAKDEFDDDQDLEAILENVSEHFAFTPPG